MPLNQVLCVMFPPGINSRRLAGNGSMIRPDLDQHEAVRPAISRPARTGSDGHQDPEQQEGDEDGSSVKVVRNFHNRCS